MFYSAATPRFTRRAVQAPAGQMLERLLADAARTDRQHSAAIAQDDKSYTLTFDVPGIAREHLSIGIEGNVVRIQSLETAPRKYKAAYELPLDIDVATSNAKLENGVLTLNLVKQLPVSRVTELAIN